MTDNQSRFTIGQVSTMTGAGIETIRYYERIGMMPKAPRGPGGYRQYDDVSLRRLSFIRRGKELGFTQKEVRGLLALVDDHAYTCGEVQEITQEHLRSVQLKIDDLHRIENVLSDMINQCAGGDVPECPIIDTLYADADL
ncbi:MAG: helix-turn-helix domain-containing protein [Gammaproteobacteria bacterium]|nr:helix-turn-helix domain-containing protein [Gammaproteobacteria bacterium]